ncbi:MULTISPECIES: hypothetical protein [Petrotoga]|uniref:6-bladed beta-propeller protein n=2 Tax=Petrotoga sibirica TaxID=156202 RepID=A0A4R8F4J7_9BACT|nr:MULTISPECIES: hypothetical protein [Petrotoga]POZ88869.1 hypothetical protein AA80_04655 [Petrotoga sibirica DSM 13575]POZ90987.1 hypothetical protein AD60_05460 [Petrotoga sp. SL27]TDX17497.1 hypothetical protein C8D74_101217 [Petrotoga sibirica]
MKMIIEKRMLLFVLLFMFTAFGVSSLFANEAKGEKEDMFMNISPSQTLSLTLAVDNPSPITDAFSFFDNKFYVYSDPDNLLVENFIEIYSFMRPEDYTTHSIAHTFPKEEYQDYELSNLISVKLGRIPGEGSVYYVGYSEKIKEVVVFSLEGDLVNTIDVGIDSKNDLLLSSPNNFGYIQNGSLKKGDFWLIDKKKNEIIMMTISGEVLSSVPATAGIKYEGIDARQFEEVLTFEDSLFIRDSSNHIFQYIYPQGFFKAIFVEELKDVEIISFAIDSLGNIFILYHSISGNKLKMAVLVEEDDGKYSAKIFHEEPFREKPVKLLAHKGFLILVTKENYQIYQTLPIIEKLKGK